jgi:hypothetical protein
LVKQFHKPTLDQQSLLACILDVNGMGTWLEKDKLSGYVEVVSFEEVFYSNRVTGAGNTGSSEDYVPHIKQIKLRCSNC